jgi:hypothetical protein
MALSIERKRLYIIPKNEPVLAAPGFFYFVLQAIEPAPIGIELPFADKGIASCERGRADQAERGK